MPPRRDVPREEPVELALMAHPIDRNIEAMLRKSQPGYFNGEGDDIGKRLEEWLEKMDDYFELTHYSEQNKAMMGRFRWRSLQSCGGRTTADRTAWTMPM